MVFDIIISDRLFVMWLWLVLRDNIKYVCTYLIFMFLIQKINSKFYIIYYIFDLSKTNYPDQTTPN